MTSKSRRTVALLVSLTMALAIGSQALAEQATVVQAGNLVMRINGSVSPKKLPKGRLAPITLNASGIIGTVDATHPPATRNVTIDFDKHGTINAKGLPVCRPGKLQSRSTAAAKKACPKAIVGKGSTAVEVAFPEQRPFTASGPLVLFNGGVHGGVTKMYIHAYVDVPTPTAIVTTVKVKKIHKGPYGTRAIATIPKIVGGSGSLVRFNFSIHRTFKFHGKRQSYLLARCANGRFRAHAVSQMSDGTRISGSILRHCTPKG